MGLELLRDGVLINRSIVDAQVVADDALRYLHAAHGAEQTYVVGEQFEEGTVFRHLEGMAGFRHVDDCVGHAGIHDPHEVFLVALVGALGSQG